MMAGTKEVTLKTKKDKLRIYSRSRSDKICCWFHCEEKEGIKDSWLEKLDGEEENLLR